MGVCMLAVWFGGLVCIKAGWVARLLECIVNIGYGIARKQRDICGVCRAVRRAISPLDSKRNVQNLIHLYHDSGSDKLLPAWPISPDSSSIVGNMAFPAPLPNYATDPDHPKLPFRLFGPDIFGYNLPKWKLMDVLRSDDDFYIKKVPNGQPPSMPEASLFLSWPEEEEDGSVKSHRSVHAFAQGLFDARAPVDAVARRRPAACGGRV